MAMKIESEAFQDGEAIPRPFTCEGQDESPPLAWSGVPADARSLVLIVDDPDAPDPKAPKMTWVHWVLFNLPAEDAGLAQSVAARDLPAGTGEGLNDWQRTGYGGPCPPIGRHRLEGLGHPTKAQVEAAMQGHILARAELVGTYAKGQ